MNEVVNCIMKCISFKETVEYAFKCNIYTKVIILKLFIFLFFLIRITLK